MWSAPREQCPADLVNRHFPASRPDEPRAAGIPPLRGRRPFYVRAFTEWACAAFITDAHSRRIIGRSTSTNL